MWGSRSGYLLIKAVALWLRGCCGQYYCQLTIIIVVFVIAWLLQSSSSFLCRSSCGVKRYGQGGQRIKVDLMALAGEVTCESPTPIQSWLCCYLLKLVKAVAGLKKWFLYAPQACKRDTGEHGVHLSCPWMSPFWTMENTYNMWYLKHLNVSIFKSFKVSDFLPWVAYFLSQAC